MSQRLRIALVAPVWLPVPPRTYGGTETIVALLAQHYTDAGHDVALFASGDSVATGATLRSVTARGLIDHMAAREAENYEHYVGALAADAVACSGDFDVIHSHLGMAQVPTLSLASCPVVHTMHTPCDVDDHWIASRYPRVTLVALTCAQAVSLPGSVRVVSSGLDLDRYPLTTATKGHLAFLGRMGPGKNPGGAIDVAAACGRDIVLAGAAQNRDEQQYFRARIEPRIDGERVRYIGSVDHRAKVRLLGDAAAMLFPIVADEAFGLVMVEAMACGTPVVACRRASVAEVVDPGITGFYADDVDALPALVDDAIALDRTEIRRRAETRFSHAAMGDSYLTIFEELTS